jgi:hypothetical protein
VGLDRTERVEVVARGIVDEASVEAVVDASVGTIEGAASMMTVLVELEVRPALSVAT